MSPFDLTEEALLRACRLYPQADTPRLAYADYLDVTGTDPGKAAFIRYQIERADLTNQSKFEAHRRLIRREIELKAEHGERWLTEFTDAIFPAETVRNPVEITLYHRGLPVRLRTRMADIFPPEVAAAVGRLCPGLQTVRLTDRTPRTPPSVRGNADRAWWLADVYPGAHAVDNRPEEWSDVDDPEDVPERVWRHFPKDAARLWSGDREAAALLWEQGGTWYTPPRRKAVSVLAKAAAAYCMAAAAEADPR